MTYSNQKVILGHYKRDLIFYNIDYQHIKKCNQMLKNVKTLIFRLLQN